MSNCPLALTCQRFNLVSEVFVEVFGEISTLSGLSNLVGVGLGVLLTDELDAPTTQIDPSASNEADVAISLFVLPNLKFQSGTPVFEKVEIKPSLLPPMFPAIQVEVAASVVPIIKMDVLVKSRSLTCSFPE